jgi:dihydroorotase
MPNILPPVCDGASLTAYRDEIQSVAPELSLLMTFKLTREMTESTLKDLKQAGAIGGKLYPRGVTTNAEDGIARMEDIYPQLELMQAGNITLNIHAEAPGVFCLHRERQFLPEIAAVMTRFPNLKIVIEHVSDEDAVEFVLNGGPNLAATITVHHLLFTLDDVIGDCLRPHHFCKPVPKHPRDREAIRRAAVSGNPKFFLGTDSAPHPVMAKESATGCAGVYSAPTAIPLLTELFDELGALDKLEPFCSRHGAAFYGLPVNKGTIRMVRSSWTVPERVGDIIPLAAGKEIAWRLSE